MQKVTVYLPEKKNPVEFELPDNAVVTSNLVEQIADYVSKIVGPSLIGFDLESIPKVIASKIREKFKS